MPTTQFDGSSAAAVARIDRLADRRTTPCGDGDMVWRRWGAGPPLVLLHGGHGSWLHWIRNIPTLADHFTVIAPDMPGLGDSASPIEPPTPEGLAAIITAGLERILPPATVYDLAGFSFGGLLGGHVAARHGGRVRSFTAVGASGLGPRRRLTQPLARRRAGQTPAEFAETQRDNLALLMFADSANVDDLALHIQIENIRRARVKSRRFARGYSLADVLPEIAARLNGIWGASDVTAPDDLGERAALFRRIQPGADFRVVPGAGHWVAYEAADRFNAILLDMLKPNDEKSGSDRPNRVPVL